MKMTIGELKALITEWINPLPDKNETESHLYHAKNDKKELMKVLSLLLQRFPKSSMTFVDQVRREFIMWEQGKGSFTKVSLAVTSLYDSVNKKKKSSFTAGTQNGSRF